MKADIEYGKTQQNSSKIAKRRTPNHVLVRFNENLGSSVKNCNQGTYSKSWIIDRGKLSKSRPTILLHNRIINQAIVISQKTREFLIISTSKSKTVSGILVHYSMANEVLVSFNKH